MKILEAYPVIIKFVMFWWCVAVFGIMSVFILDHFVTKLRGPAAISWSTKFVFDGRASREAYWSEFANPGAWSTSHPIVATADVRMVQVSSASDGSTSAPAASSAPVASGTDQEAESESLNADDGEPPEPSERLKPIDMKPLAPGLGMIMRHKSGSGPREGLFFCARECTSLETPEAGPWHIQTRTIEVGAGYPFLVDSEVSDVILQPPGENGSIACEMRGTGAVTSRLWCWWMCLEKVSIEAAEAMMQSINDELGRSKKDD